MRVEYAALSALACGAVLGTIGLGSETLSVVALAVCLVGVALLWSSKVWTTLDKVVGVMLIPIGFWVIELVHFAHRESSNDLIEIIDRAVVVFIVVTDVLVSVAALTYLIIRLRHETQAN